MGRIKQESGGYIMGSVRELRGNYGYPDIELYSKDSLNFIERVSGTKACEFDEEPYYSYDDTCIHMYYNGNRGVLPVLRVLI